MEIQSELGIEAGRGSGERVERAGEILVKAGRERERVESEREVKYGDTGREGNRGRDGDTVRVGYRGGMREHGESREGRGDVGESGERERERERGDGDAVTVGLGIEAG